MPGADLSIDVAPREPMGVRRPRHIYQGYQLRAQQLKPFMAAPLRPGEVLEGVNIMGRTVSSTLFSMPQAPMAWAELGVWVVPLSTLHQFFIDLVVSSGEDIAERTPDSAAGTGARIAQNPVTDHGHLTPGLQGALRRWAGEVGGNSGGNIAIGSEYAPYVSWATYKVARDWYDLEDQAGGWEDSNLFDNPPLVGEWVKSPLLQSFDTGILNLDEANIGSSTLNLSDLVERMFLLTQPETTYAQYLANHSVNPRSGSIGGISSPVLLTQGFLSPFGAPQMAQGFYDGFTNKTFEENNFEESWRADEVEPLAGFSHFYSTRGLCHFGHKWNMNARRRRMITEPSVLLGTICMYQPGATAEEYVHHFDMTRMTHPGHWGNRSFGGIDEEDFIATQTIYNTAGTGLQTGGEPDQTGTQVMNLLNLYLHGDSVAPDNVDDLAFRNRGAGGPEIDQNNERFNTQLSVDLAVRSDLVA
jgi:hypothetical protein